MSATTNLASILGMMGGVGPMASSAAKTAVDTTGKANNYGFQEDFPVADLLFFTQMEPLMEQNYDVQLVDADDPFNGFGQTTKYVKRTGENANPVYEDFYDKVDDSYKSVEKALRKSRFSSTSTGSMLSSLLGSSSSGSSSSLLSGSSS